ncbi:MAG: sigma-70 family RNA polymerase sigma factor [Bacteroidales bacterium]|nr:sigma-70 family RNA polymerase sigma factor [Bacteroidales bacterium]
MGKRKENEQALSDPELIRRCSEGEVRAQELLYRRYFSFAMSVALRYTCDEGKAMEIVNDSYMKVLDKISEFDNKKAFRSWYGRIVVNSAIDNFRRNARHSSHLQISDIGTQEEQEPEIDATLSAADILNLFSQLPENYRLTFNLFEIEGYTHDEIGKMLGITASSSRSTLARAKKALRELYIKNFNPEKSNNEVV